MSNLQLYFAIGLPCTTVIASVIISLFQISGVHEDIREIRSDMKFIVSKLAELCTRMSVIEERIK